MPPKKTTTPMTDAAIKQLIAQGIADALAKYETNRSSKNSDDSHDSRSGRRRTEHTTREYTYSNFLKCQPFNFKGTERVIGLTQRFEKIASVFHISNCTIGNQIKFATCTLLGSVLTLWNSHVKTVGHDAAYGMTWKILMKMLTNNYTQRFQDLALLCGRMFPEESDQVDKYVGVLPDMIQVPTSSTQFLLAVKFSLPGLLESPGLMEKQDLYICVAEEDMACTTSTPDNEVTYMTETEVREFNAKLEKKHVNNKYNMVTSCSYDNLKKLYDELQKQFSDLNEQYNENYIQAQAYKSSLKTLEKQKKVLQNNQLVFEEKIRVLSSELENTTNLLKYSEKVNAEMSLEKQDLQAKLENERAINAKWTSSSKNLVKLIDSSMTVRTKIGLGFDEYIGENELGWDDSEFSVFTPTPEDVEGKPLYNRFVKTDRMKAVPPPLSGNYIPLSDPTDLDESQMTYGPKQTHTSDSEPKTSDLDSCESNSSVESLESMPKPVIIEPKTSEYASCKSNLSAESPEFFPKSVCARNESVRKADNPRKNNKSPRGNKRSWNGMMTQKLGENFEFNNKACYVCGRFSHLHYTCKNKRKVNDQKQVTPVWNNSRRVNHQNSGRFSHPSPKSNMVPQALLTKSGLVYVNSLKRLFQKKTPNYNRYFNRSVNSVKDTRVHTARPKTEVNTVKASASWVWKPKQEVIDHVSKSNNASKTLTRYDYVDAYGRFKTVLAWDFKRH
ncbi:hypothetical protein Tco_0611343 [Tanacetum coccineum]